MCPLPASTSVRQRTDGIEVPGLVTPDDSKFSVNAMSHTRHGRVYLLSQLARCQMQSLS